MSLVFTDHPGWRETHAGTARVLIDDAGARYVATAEDGLLHCQPLDDGCTTVRPIVVRPPARIAVAVSDLSRRVRSMGAVYRLPNPSLWDALATAVIRQVVRASHASGMYRRMCDAYGRPVDVNAVTYRTFPSPQTILDLTDEQFVSVGLAFKRHALRSLATAFLDRRVHWLGLDAADLVVDLQTVPRVGAWTAGAAVADYSGDFSLYPYADLAVRTWASKAAPGFAWPTSEPEFGRLWRDIAGRHLNELTMLTLAWGKHHGDWT